MIDSEHVFSTFGWILLWFGCLFFKPELLKFIHNLISAKVFMKLFDETVKTVYYGTVIRPLLKETFFYLGVSVTSREIPAIL